MAKWKDFILVSEAILIILAVGIIIGYVICNNSWLGVLHKDLELSITQPAPPVRGKK